jgi:hypothetical protein
MMIANRVKPHVWFDAGVWCFGTRNRVSVTHSGKNVRELSEDVMKCNLCNTVHMNPGGWWDLVYALNTQEG